MPNAQWAGFVDPEVNPKSEGFNWTLIRHSPMRLVPPRLTSNDERV